MLINENQNTRVCGRAFEFRDVVLCVLRVLFVVQCVRACVCRVVCVRAACSLFGLLLFFAAVFFSLFVVLAAVVAAAGCCFCAAGFGENAADVHHAPFVWSAVSFCLLMKLKTAATGRS